MPDQDVTLGEVYRLVKDMRAETKQQLAEIRAYQVRQNGRVDDAEEAIGELRTKTAVLEERLHGNASKATGGIAAGGTAIAAFVVDVIYRWLSAR